MIALSSNIALSSPIGNSSSSAQNASLAGANITVLASANGTGFNPLTGLGELSFVGQLLNNDTIPSNDTQVTTQLYDFTGKLIGFNTTDVGPVEPGAVVNFKQKFSDLDIIGGSANAVFYDHSTNKASLPFFGFIPPPFLAGTGVGAALAAGGALGSGGGLAAGGGGFGGGASGGGSGGGGGGGDITIRNEYSTYIDCLINQANQAENVEGGVEQVNVAICNKFTPPPVAEPPLTPPPTTTPTPTPTPEPPIPVGEPGGAANDDGTCNDGQEPVDLVCPEAIETGGPGQPPNADGECNDGQEPVDDICPEPAEQVECDPDTEVLVGDECEPIPDTAATQQFASPPAPTPEPTPEPEPDTNVQQENQEQAVESNDDGDSND